MADLDFLERATPMIIVGADDNGAETFPVGANDRGELKILAANPTSEPLPVLQKKLVVANETQVTAGNNVIVPVRAGAQNLIGRKYVYIHTSQANCFFGFLAANQFFPLPQDAVVILEIYELDVYLVKKQGGGNATFTFSELSENFQ